MASSCAADFARSESTTDAGRNIFCVVRSSPLGSFAVALLALVPACSGAPMPRDAGFDASDAYVTPDTIPDDMTTCDMPCPAGRFCCLGASGPHCVDLATDVTNCGLCNRDCVTSRRGDSCANNQCGCGDFAIGCTGNENSICCPALGGMGPYCANPGLELTNCGACGHVCDRAQSNQCQGGICFCGDHGTACAGTPQSTCCADPAGFFACADTTTDQAHCGGCGRRCMAFEHCVGGACVPTISDAGTDGG
jgi:hypothetical protein